MKKEYFEIEWYDENRDMWLFNNRFASLSEAREFINSGRCICGKKLRIVYRTFMVVEKY